MDDHPDDVSTTDDLTLVGLARAGDRLAFGILYLRHHAAAWRMACVASRFSPDAELAVIEGFSRVFSALPEESEEFEARRATFRPYLLACVRQSALDRARASGRAETDGDAARPDPGIDRRSRRRSKTGPPAPAPPPAMLAGLTVDGEVRLSGLEHHVARAALASLSEPARTALWLSDVEAMTPGEVAAILGVGPEEIVEVATAARAALHDMQQVALDRQEVRAECRFSADHLAAFDAGALEPADGLLVRAHLAGCLACRMRRGELTNAPAALAAAVPAAPLLGGEAQHLWLVSISDIRPAERLLPPILAAGGTITRESLVRRTATHLGAVAGAATAPARRLPDALRRARAAAGTWQADSIDLTTRTPRPNFPQSPARPGSAADPVTSPGWTEAPGRSGSPVPSLPPAWTIPPGRASWVGAVPRLAHRARRATGPALPAMALAVAWVLVMMSLPRLMTPATSPGPGGLALPAVQAYVPGFPSALGRKSGSPPPSTAPSAGLPAGGPDDPALPGLTDFALSDGSSFGLVAAASGPGAARPPRPGARAGQPSVSLPAPVPTIAPTAGPTISLIPTVVTSPADVVLDIPTAPQEGIDAGTAPTAQDLAGDSGTDWPKAVKAKATKSGKAKTRKAAKPAAVRPGTPAAVRPEKAGTTAQHPSKVNADRPSRPTAGPAPKPDRIRRSERPDRPRSRSGPRIFTA